MTEYVKIAAGVHLDGVTVVVGTVLVRSIGNGSEIAVALNRLSKNVDTVV